MTTEDSGAERELRRRMEALRGVGLFADLEENALREMARCCRPLLRRTGTILLAQGHSDEPSDGSLYLILEGRVRVDRETPDGGATAFLGERGPGEPLGEMALIDDRPRSATVTVVKDCRLVQLTRADFLRAIRTHPEIALKMMGHLANRLREANVRLTQRETMDTLQRLIAHLLEISAPGSELGEAEPDGWVRFKQWTDRSIGERIDADQKTVTRKMAYLREKKAVRREGRDLLIHRAALTRIAETVRGW